MRSGLQQPLADAVHQLAIRCRQIVQQAVDGLHDDTPLRQAGDGAQRTEARFHFDRHANTELRIVLHLFAFSGSGRGTSDAATGIGLLRHGTVRRSAAPPSIDSVHRVRIDSGEAAADHSCKRDLQIERHASDCLNKSEPPRRKPDDISANPWTGVVNNPHRSVAKKPQLMRATTTFFRAFRGGVDVALRVGVSEPLRSHGERRAEGRADRRKNSRSGRRAADPHVNWRRLTWLFEMYAVFMSVRSLPSTVKRFFTRESSPSPS